MLDDALNVLYNHMKILSPEKLKGSKNHAKLMGEDGNYLGNQLMFWNV
jgi:hypothetical protein